MVGWSRTDGHKSEPEINSTDLRQSNNNSIKEECTAYQLSCAAYHHYHSQVEGVKDKLLRGVVEYNCLY